MRNINKRFSATAALDNVTFAVPAGEIHTLIGENGAGKSTLMKILSGALKPDAGTMAIDGIDYAPTDPLHARKQGVAMIYQELSLAPHLTVAENILLGLEKTRHGLLQKADMLNRARQALAELEHPEIDPNARVDTLTIAARQIVEIARALAVQCRVLVLDEPTSSLTRADAERLFRVMRRLKNRDLAIVYISHFLEEIKQIADCFTVLRDGQTVGSGSTSSTSGPDQLMNDLSGGNQQKVALARLLHHDVDCLLLDEPTRGIDIASKADIYRLIDQLATQGKAILLVSSYLPELLGICDRIAVMHRGHLGPAHPADQCTEHSLMLEATGREVSV